MAREIKGSHHFGFQRLPTSSFFVFLLASVAERNLRICRGGATSVQRICVSRSKLRIQPCSRKLRFGLRKRHRTFLCMQPNSLASRLPMLMKNEPKTFHTHEESTASKGA